MKPLPITFYREMPDGPLVSGLPQLRENYPILVVGCGHSGTTMMLSLLAASKYAVGVPMQTGAFKGPKGVWQWFDKRLNTKWLPQLYKRKPHAIRWIEKSPDHVSYAMQIYEWFEGKVYFVVMLRDGRNVLTSNLKNPSNPLTENEERAYQDAFNNYKRYAAESIELVQKLPQNAIGVSYERFIEYPEFHLKRISDFAHIKFQNTFWDDWKQDRLWCVENKNDFEKKRIKRNEIANDNERWKQDKYKMIVERFMMDTKIQEIMRELGYIE